MSPAPEPRSPDQLGLAVRLDVRDARAFAAGHLAGAGNVPAAELEARSFELPARDAEVVAVAECSERARAAAAVLAGLGYERARYLDARPAVLSALFTDRARAARLWRPAPFLEEIGGALPAGRALDAAAGSCRNAVFLALRGLHAEAVDLHPEALRRGRALALHEGVALDAWAQDLERHPWLPAGRYQVVTCFRFLFRPLLPRLAQALAPGGHLVYETYRHGKRRWPRPRRDRFLLEPGELRAAFSELEVLRSEEPEPEQAPATARIWARRPE